MQTVLPRQLCKLCQDCLIRKECEEVHVALANASIGPILRVTCVRDHSYRIGHCCAEAFLGNDISPVSSSPGEIHWKQSPLVEDPPPHVLFKDDDIKM